MVKAALHHEADVILFNEAMQANISIVCDAVNQRHADAGSRAGKPPVRVVATYVAPSHRSLTMPPMKHIEDPVGALWGVLPGFARSWVHMADMYSWAGWKRPTYAYVRRKYKLAPRRNDCVPPADALRLHLLPGMLFRRPADWDETLDNIPGQILGLHRAPLPEALAAWIAAEPDRKPIYVGYGSMTLFQKCVARPVLVCVCVFC